MSAERPSLSFEVSFTLWATERKERLLHFSAESLFTTKYTRPRSSNNNGRYAVSSGMRACIYPAQIPKPHPAHLASCMYATLSFCSDRPAHVLPSRHCPLRVSLCNPLKKKNIRPGNLICTLHFNEVQDRQEKGKTISYISRESLNSSNHCQKSHT